MARPACDSPLRVHFITDADRGYTLSQIRVAPDGGLLYGELHQRPTDERLHRALPAVAILRSADELPTVGRRFRPEILSSIARSTVVLDTGRVEIVWEDPPSHILDPGLQARVDDFLKGRTPADEYAGLREALAGAVAGAVTRLGPPPDPDDRSTGWMDSVDADLAGLPVGWVQDLADARRVLEEIDADETPRRRGSREHASV